MGRQFQPTIPRQRGYQSVDICSRALPLSQLPPDCSSRGFLAAADRC